MDDGKIYVGSELIGTVNFKIIDRSMGGIGGELQPHENYQKYQRKIQAITEAKGIANVEDFDFRITLKGKLLSPAGGIGITDVKGFPDIWVESAGNCHKTIQEI